MPAAGLANPKPNIKRSRLARNPPSGSRGEAVRPDTIPLSSWLAAASSFGISAIGWTYRMDDRAGHGGVRGVGFRSFDVSRFFLGIVALVGHECISWLGCDMKKGRGRASHWLGFRRSGSTLFMLISSKTPQLKRKYSEAGGSVASAELEAGPRRRSPRMRSRLCRSQMDRLNFRFDLFT